MDLFPEIEVSALQAEAFARGLYAVALVDGVHERELALISDFYRAAVSEGAPVSSAASLERSGPLGPSDLAQHLVGEPIRALFVRAAYLLAWADGKVTDDERVTIAEYAAALGLPDDKRRAAEDAVKDFLVRPLAGLANVAAASAVVKKLGL
jgi:hypothetical protein